MVAEASPMFEASQSPSRFRFCDEPLAVSADVVGQTIVDEQPQAPADVADRGGCVREAGWVGSSLWHGGWPVSNRSWIEVVTGLAQMQQGAAAGCGGVEDGRLVELLRWQGREQPECGPDQRLSIGYLSRH